MSFLAEAIDRLSGTPGRAVELTRGLSEEQLSRKLDPKFFSLRENVLHLRDIDIEGYEKRVQRILSETSPVLEDVNGGRLARERNYNALPVAPALAELAQSREASVERLKQCGEADLERTAEMQGSGVVTLRRLLEMWMRHDAEHLADMAELRRAVEANDLNVSFGEHEAA